MNPPVTTRSTAVSSGKKTCSCPECESGGRPLPVAEFGANASSPDGLHWYCRNCNNRKQREWKRANPKKVRKWKSDYDERQRVKNTSGKQLELDL